MDNASGVGVLDKSTLVLNCLAEEPRSLSDLVAATGMPRPTVYRISAALVNHRFVERDDQGMYRLGPRLRELARLSQLPQLGVLARDILDDLSRLTAESVQIFVPTQNGRRCVAAVEPDRGLRDTVPVGAVLTLSAGSAAQVLLAWLPAPSRRAWLVGARFNAADLERVRMRGWAQSIGQREPGVCSVSAPIFARPTDTGSIVAKGVPTTTAPEPEVPLAAICVSGPQARMTVRPGKRYAGALQEAGQAIAARLAEQP
ncbi:MAG: IclR family transcriptional regulator [Candidatus Nanopelagicales bacterium]|jgi:DNA-binding IclR family transcriptional regulator|nr:IclR family transcriptional regulator [Candidatus Nanopelagicales bacterium]